jgi:hypothetical protein
MKVYRPQNHRRRVRTESVGLMVSKAEAAILKAHVIAQRTNISEYLRAVAIQPLLEAQQVQVGFEDDPAA